MAEDTIDPSPCVLTLYRRAKPDEGPETITIQADDSKDVAFEAIRLIARLGQLLPGDTLAVHRF